MAKPRRKFTEKQKAAIVRRHLKTSWSAQLEIGPESFSPRRQGANERKRGEAAWCCATEAGSHLSFSQSRRV